MPGLVYLNRGAQRELGGILQIDRSRRPSVGLEPRGAWDDAEVKAICQSLDLIHCVDPFERQPVFGDPAYFRLHGKGGYHYQYTYEELIELLRLCRSETGTYVLFNNTAMFEDARHFLALEA